MILIVSMYSVWWLETEISEVELAQEHPNVGRVVDLIVVVVSLVLWKRAEPEMNTIKGVTCGKSAISYYSFYEKLLLPKKMRQQLCTW